MPDTSIAVILRDLTRDDLEPLHKLLSDWTVVRYMLLPHCGSREETAKCLDSLIAAPPGGAWRSYVRVIHEPGSGDAVGLCGIAALQGSDEGEIWYLVSPDRWGRGIAVEAARALLKVGFSEMALNRMVATCLPENPASARVLEKIGMRREGCELKTLNIHGVWRGCLLYSILRGEWEIAVP